jgi:DNA/RNA endonuclease YhcR with UshA esterase domain
MALLMGLAFVGGACRTGENAAPVTSNGGGSSATTSACGFAPLSWQDAGAHVGDRATVKGAVVDANYASSSNGKPTFLNVGKPYPDPARFTVLIWGENRDSFPKAPEVAYKGRTICVTGLIATYQGSPEILVDSPSQITIAD